MDRKAYQKYADDRAKHTHCLQNCMRAFWVGGTICLLGQILGDLYQWAGLEKQQASLCVSVTLIFLAGLLTGIGWFDKIAKYAGAGTLVPITGFSNAVAAPAIDARAEGYVTGVASKMFVIAGPVIVYGSACSILYGLIYYFFLI